MPYKLRESLSQFSANLVPDAEFEERGKAACQKIFLILQSQREDVAEVKISGSMGKRTAVYYPGMQEPDFDVVIFLNIPNLEDVCHPEEGPPFRRFLREFHTVFREHHSIKILNSAAPNFLRIEISQVKLDVSPAIFFKNSERPPDKTPVAHQRVQTLKLIRSLENPEKFGFYYSPGLSEAGLDYFKREAARLNAHPLIRLAKFWNRSLELPREVRYATGRSFLIERMALFAAQEVGDDEEVNYTLLSSLEKFLQLMSVFGNILVHKPFPCRLALYLEEENPGIRPIVLDPVNPFSNLAQLNHYSEMRRKIIRCFEEGADHSLEKLKIVKWRLEQGERFEGVDLAQKILDQSELNFKEDEPTPVQIQFQPEGSLPSSSYPFIPAWQRAGPSPEEVKDEKILKKTVVAVATLAVVVVFGFVWWVKIKPEKLVPKTPTNVSFWKKLALNSPPFFYK